MLQIAGLIELLLRLSENIGVAATDFGEMSQLAIRGRRRKRIPILSVRGFRYVFKGRR